MKMFKKSIVLIIFILIISGIIGKFYVFAQNNDNVVLAEYTNEYKEWLKLSEEERAKVIEPRMFEVPKEDKKEITFFYAQTPYEEKYNLKDYISENVVIRNQMNTGGCWAFSGLGSLESTLALKNYKEGKPVVTYDFSERHLVYSSVRDFTDGSNEYGMNKNIPGGNSDILVSYLSNGMGAIKESDMPFENNENKISLSEIQNKEVVTTLLDTVDFPSYTVGTDDLTEIKEKFKHHVKEYGGVMVSIYGAQPYSDYYNRSTGAIYCDNKTSCPVNHQVLIVGWDDTYDVSNFSSLHRPSNPGAWIIKNSWGTSLGNNGFMYLSYEDVNVYSYSAGIMKALDTKDYDNIYQYNKVGYNYQGSYFSNTLYLANVFEKKSNKSEYVTKVSLNCPQTLSCKVYINANGDSKNASDLTLVELAEETDNTEILEPGYHTIEFKNPVKILSDKFVIAVEMTSDTTVNYRFEKQDDNRYKYIEVPEGACFISRNMQYWNTIGGNSTLKAFTIVREGTDINCNVTSYGKDNSLVTHIEVFKEGNSIADYEYDVIGTGTKNLKMESIPFGNYKVKISKQNHTTREYNLVVDETTDNMDFKICPIGDVNGDGNLDLIDWNRLYNHLNGTQPLTDYNLLCGDVDNDNITGMVDWNRIYNHLNKKDLLW